MKESKVQELIDSENGIGFYKNVNTKGYKFTKNNSFIVFEMKVISDVRVANIKYLYYDSIEELTTLLAYATNFWMGNKIEFFVMKEHDKVATARELFLELGFEDEVKENVSWPYKFEPINEYTKNTVHLTTR